MKLLKVLCFSVLVLSGVNSIAEPNQWCHPKKIKLEKGQTRGDDVAIWTGSALMTRNVAQIREIFDSTNSPNCLGDDGKPQLGSFASGVSNYFKENPGEKGLETVKFFKKAAPKETLSALIEAQYWIDYAWHARGSAYASSVSEDGWRMFHERIAKAEVVLSESKPYASSNPIWYENMLIVKSVGKASRRERDALFMEGVQKFSWYVPLYFVMAEYLAPWWGGNWEMIDNMASWSVEQTKPSMGTAMYTRIYWAISEHYTQVPNVFQTTKAKWPKMKQGFDDLTNRFPSMWNLNAYARFACDAGDRATYLTLRKRIGDDGIDERAWKSTHHEVCDSKFGRTR